MNVFMKFWVGASAVSLAALPVAQAELVYEDEIAEAEQTDAPSTVTARHDRENLRQVIDSARRAQVTAQAAQPQAQIVAQPQAVAPQPQVVAQPAPQYIVVAQAPIAQSAASAEVESDAAPLRASQQVDVQHLSKGEILRRARMREELKNEDMLQERLEELRLRDERRRTDQLLGVTPKEVAPIPTGLGALKEEFVGSQPGAQPIEVVSAQQVQMAQPRLVEDQIVTSSAAATPAAAQGQSAVKSSELEEKTHLMITPRAGIANMSSNNLFDTVARYSAGFGLGVGVSDHLTFEVGYTFSEYGVGIASSNPVISYLQFYTGSAYTNNFATYIMRQNVFDAGMKLHLLGRESKFRPFVGGGAAYARSYMNYDSTILSILNGAPGYQSLAADYETSSFLGFLQAGFDVSISKSVQIGSTFRYYNVFSATENQSLNSAGFIPGYYYGFNPDPTKTAVGGSLARSNFYSVMGTATFSF